MVDIIKIKNEDLDNCVFYNTFKFSSIYDVEDDNKEFLCEKLLDNNFIIYYKGDMFFIDSGLRPYNFTDKYIFDADGCFYDDIYINHLIFPISKDYNEKTDYGFLSEIILDYLDMLYEDIKNDK